MIFEYIQLLGSASAKDIFNQTMGAYMKDAEINSPHLTKDPIRLRRTLTEIIQAKLDGLVANGSVTKLTHSTGQIFYVCK